MTPNEQQAEAAIRERFAEAVVDGEPPSLDEFTRIASSYGVYPADEFARVVTQECVLIFLGKAWGVGPRANLWDRFRVSFGIWWNERLPWRK